MWNNIRMWQQQRQNNTPHIVPGTSHTSHSFSHFTYNHKYSRCLKKNNIIYPKKRVYNITYRKKNALMKKITYHKNLIKIKFPPYTYTYTHTRTWGHTKQKYVNCCCCCISSQWIFVYNYMYIRYYIFISHTHTHTLTPVYKCTYIHTYTYITSAFSARKSIFTAMKNLNINLYNIFFFFLFQYI